MGADRAFFDGNVTAGVVTFPDALSPRDVPLAGDEVSIGRPAASPRATTPTSTCRRPSTTPPCPAATPPSSARPTVVGGGRRRVHQRHLAQRRGRPPRPRRGPGPPRRRPAPAGRLHLHHHPRRRDPAGSPGDTAPAAPAVPPPAPPPAPRRRSAPPPRPRPPAAWSPAPSSRLRAASRRRPGATGCGRWRRSAVLVLAAVAATASAARMRGATDRVRTNSGPVLVATQQLVASLAEADAAQTAAFLSGRDEDPEQRRLYEQALARAGQQIEEIASLVGDDPTVHDLLQRVSVGISPYAGLVEAARASNGGRGRGRHGYLVQSVEPGQRHRPGRPDPAHRGHPGAPPARTRTAAPRVGHRPGRGRRRRRRRSPSARPRSCRASRRVVNLPLARGHRSPCSRPWCGWSSPSRGAATAIRDARRDGYDSIVLTAQLQTAGFGAKAAETLALITGDPAQRAAADSRANAVAVEPVTAGVAASIRSGDRRRRPRRAPRPGAAETRPTPRERAAVAEVAERWQRYRDRWRHCARRPTAADARARSRWAARTPIQRVQLLGRGRPRASRAQFLAGLATGRRPHVASPHRRPAPGAGGRLAALWGFQLRINEYR